MPPLTKFPAKVIGYTEQIIKQTDISAKRENKQVKV